MADSKENQLSEWLQYTKVTLREVYKHRLAVAITFAVLSLGFVGLGLIASKTYTTSATLFADRANIIKPLLSGQAAVTQVEDQTRVVRETIYSPRVMSKVVQNVGILKGNESPAEVEQITNRLRSRVEVQGISESYIKVSFSANEPAQTFNVLQSVIEVFIKESSDAKRSESRQAYEFINSQVESYKSQLQTADQKLREFKSNSTDGTEESVNERISQLRNTVETLKLDIEGIRTKIGGIQGELGKENRYMSQQNKVSIYRNSLSQAESRMATLLLTYTDTHPDVVALRYQIEDIKKAIHQTENEESVEDDVTVNPLYEDLRLELSESKVALQTRLTRLSSTEKLLREEHERLKRVAENQAQLSELNRDYNVTRGIYEDMLERKERARLSMTLDIEGRGLTFKVQEPPAYPLSPTGLRFVHYLIGGPILGVLIPLGIIIAFIIVDPRIRYAKTLNNFQNVELLGEVGHTISALRSRLFKKDVFMVGTIMLIVIGGYATAIFYKLVIA